jgi:GntR family transcriptional regulator of vanillate catabolism
MSDPAVFPTVKNESYAAKIVYELSQQIIGGEIASGQPLLEIELAERFAVSRTPVRQALSALEQEGLLVRNVNDRSYSVRNFKLQEILDAIQVRGALEGLAVHSLARQRLPSLLIRELDEILDEAGDVIAELQERPENDRELTERYFAINSRFHAAIIEASRNTAITAALAQVAKIPFVSVGSMARFGGSIEETDERRRERISLNMFSHFQHQEILDAIKSGDSSRAESLMREHANLGVRNLHLRRDRISIQR